MKPIQLSLEVAALIVLLLSLHGAVNWLLTEPNTLLNVAGVFAAFGGLAGLFKLVCVRAKAYTQ